jgi:oligopeptide/dipeptide ABC transporter ATP-binding protein
MSSVAALAGRGLVVERPRAGMRGLLGRGPASRFTVVDGVDLELFRGRALALVGESGSGKTTLGRALLRLVPLKAGEVELGGLRLTHLSERAMQPLRRRMQPVFQDASAALDPRLSVAAAVEEGLLVHRLATGPELAERARRALAEVGVGAELLGRRPHQLSGGQRQRVAIARALALRPEVLIADEPVASLDAMSKAALLALFARLRREHALALLFISHELAAVERVADEVAVMFAGRIIERLSVSALADALHPYTRALLAAALGGDPERRRPRAVAREAASVARPAGGCVYLARCPHAEARCVEGEVPLVQLGGGRSVACRVVTGA